MLLIHKSITVSFHFLISARFGRPPRLGFDADVEKQLKRRTKPGRQTEVNQYNEIYGILFPGEALQVPVSITETSPDNCARPLPLPSAFQSRYKSVSRSQQQ
jgi:hypothetical protein